MLSDKFLAKIKAKRQNPLRYINPLMIKANEDVREILDEEAIATIIRQQRFEENEYNITREKSPEKHAEDSVKHIFLYLEGKK